MSTCTLYVWQTKTKTGEEMRLHASEQLTTFPQADQAYITRQASFGYSFQSILTDKIY